MHSDSIIYIVDDDEAVRDSLAALLATHGLQTETFASTAAFLTRYHPDCTGCLLLDVRMPGMTGLKLLEFLASQRSRLPVIIITGHGNMPMAVTAMRLGAVEFLEKPYSDHDLLEAIERALTAGQQSRPKGTKR